MLYKLLRPLVVLLFKLLFRIEIKGKENFPKEQPFILASNHLSNLDPIVLGVACPYRLYFIAKEELFQEKIFAFFLKKLGAIPLKRKKIDLRTIKKGLFLLKKEKKPLAIFPQGRRSLDYERFLPGVGFFYKKTSFPIVAAKIYGTEEVLPKEAKFIKLGKIKVIFDRVQNINKEDDYREITFKVLEKIKNL